jgi:hypothetical protein
MTNLARYKDDLKKLVEAAEKMPLDLTQRISPKERDGARATQWRREAHENLVLNVLAARRAHRRDSALPWPCGLMDRARPTG